MPDRADIGSREWADDHTNRVRGSLAALPLSHHRASGRPPGSGNDDALGLSAMAGETLADARTGKNGRHALVGGCFNQCSGVSRVTRT